MSTKYGICRLCGLEKKLSFEHIPPKAAFNKRPISIQRFENLIDTGTPLFGKSSRSNRGFGQFTLCEPCNKNTGAWYGKDFIEFAKQGMEIIKRHKPGSPVIVGDYFIKPLNVFKQILVMFMSADKGGHLLADDSLRNYLLQTDSLQIPNEYKVFIYSNLSPFKRMVGVTYQYVPKLGRQIWAEINFEPFGYLLAIDSEKAHKNMCDITSFKSYKFDETIKMKMTTAYLKVEKPFPGIYE